MKLREFLIRTLALSTLILPISSCKSELTVDGAPDAEWTVWGGSQHGNRHSSLTQIDRNNVRKLKPVWTFHTGDLGEGRASRAHLTFEATPLMFDGALFFNTAYGKAFSIDAQTGEERWMHDAAVDQDLEYGGAVAARGLTLWVDEESPDGAFCRMRLLMGTIDGRLIELDAQSGKLCDAFGVNGTVDLTEGISLTAPGMVGVTSPPVIFDDIVIVGSSVGDFRGVRVERGLVRAYDVRSGALLWSWSPIPLGNDDPAWSTWENGSATIEGAGNAWASLSVDEELGLVYVPTSAPGSAFYGGHRPGDNHYTSGLAALRADSGELAWFRQLVHHDVWDYDTPAQPVLVDLDRNGTNIPAVVQVTKMGLVFVFDRRTGEPVFGIEERPVPPSDLHGEALSPTQPFPTAPPPLLDQSAVTAKDAWGITPWDRHVCARRLKQIRSEGIYTPPSLEGSLLKPGIGGGMNWGSASYDKERQLLIVNVIDMPSVVRMLPKQQEIQSSDDGSGHSGGESMVGSELIIAQNGVPYDLSFQFLLSPFGVPCTRPPWGKLAAIDLSDGSIAWESPLGTTEDLTPWFIPPLRLGVPNIGGSIITGSGLIFIGAAMDDYLRAFDLQTGKELWKARLPAGGQATPMTYAIGGKQYVVIAAGGHGSFGTKQGDALVAFALPQVN